jgi:hypothetical protein
VAKLWSTVENDWVNSYKYEYEYQEVVANEDNDVIVNNFSVSVYPNPLVNKVKYASKQQINKVSVYNLKGQKIYYSLLNNKKGTLNALNIKKYPSGIYFFRFEDNKGNTTTTKQIKLK